MIIFSTVRLAADPNMAGRYVTIASLSRNSAKAERNAKTIVLTLISRKRAIGKIRAIKAEVWKSSEMPTSR